MFKNILVGLDFGDTSDAVFQKAVSLARSIGAKLTLLGVLIPVEERSVYEGSYREYELKELDRLKGFAQKAQAVGIDAEVVQVAGSTGWAICEQAKTADVDLLMVGSHGRMGLSEMLLGSVSNYVMHHADCSVLVVHE
ncbi:MAG: universal stress protein [Cyanobacteria bacterium J06634_6]